MGRLGVLHKGVGVLGVVKKCSKVALISVAQLASFHKVKGLQFNSWSRHMPGLQVQSPVGACARDHLSRFLSHIDVSLPPFLSL